MSSCVCRRVDIKNLMPTSLVINYTKCSDQQVITNYEVPPTETREIWYLVGSFSTASPPSSYEMNNVTLWPEGCDVEPEVETFFILFEDSDIMTSQDNYGIEYQY
jgi:hypothetical protein